MNISYKNMLGESITSQQIINSSKYYKIYSVASGDIKKKEAYRNNQLTVIDYYLDDDETDEEVITALLSNNCTITIIDKEDYQNYKIEHRRIYIEGLLTRKTKLLYNPNEVLICSELINLVTNQPEYQHTQKYLGEIDDVEDDYYCRFKYNADGSFNYCEFKYLSEYDSEHFELDTLPEIKDRFALSDAMYNYYLTATLLPPLT